jgi:hypothetical protein
VKTLQLFARSLDRGFATGVVRSVFEGEAFFLRNGSIA